jgi:hypothetical protein
VCLSLDPLRYMRLHNFESTNRIYLFDYFGQYTFIASCKHVGASVGGDPIPLGSFEKNAGEFQNV